MARSSIWTKLGDADLDCHGGNTIYRGLSWREHLVILPSSTWMFPSYLLATPTDRPFCGGVEVVLVHECSGCAVSASVVSAPWCLQLKRVGNLRARGEENTPVGYSTSSYYILSLIVCCIQVAQSVVFDQTNKESSTLVTPPTSWPAHSLCKSA